MESMALVSAIAQSQDAPNIAEPSTVGLLAGAALAWRSCVGTYTAIRGLAMDIDDQWTVTSEGNGKVLQLSDDEEHAGAFRRQHVRHVRREERDGVGEPDARRGGPRNVCSLFVLRQGDAASDDETGGAQETEQERERVRVTVAGQLVVLRELGVDRGVGARRVFDRGRCAFAEHGCRCA